MRPVPITGKSTQKYKAPDLDQVAFDGAMSLYLDGKYGDAEKSFQQFLARFSRSGYRYRALYWLGKSFLRDGNKAEARKVFLYVESSSPLSYYGILASLETGKDVASFLDSSLPEALDTDPFLKPVEHVRLKRAKLFLAAGARRLASYELKFLYPRDVFSSGFLMYLAMLDSKAGNYVNTFQILGELAQRKDASLYTSYCLRMVFPMVYRDLIEKSAVENNLDPILVLSLIKQESAFDERTTSWAGAQGLMQLMPATAVRTASEIQRADLIEAKANIRVGTRYLKDLLDEFHGNIVFALAAYNAGPNATNRWVRQASPKYGIEEFIESIPYKETREYVASIIRNYFWYSRKLKGVPVTSLDYFWRGGLRGP